MEYRLHYDRGFVTLEIPDRNVAGFVRPWQDAGPSDNSGAVRRALSGRGATQLRRSAAGKRVCVLLNDGTRDTPYADVLEQMLPLLTEGSFVRFAVCTGTHDGDTPENERIIRDVERLADAAGLRSRQICVHDHRSSSLVQAGRTSRGTPITYNPWLDEADVFVVLSDVKVHYFAGYSNPVKNFVPGLCAYETAEGNHSLSLDDRSTYGVHPWHADPARRDNPLACDQLEAMQRIVRGRGVYAFVTVSTSGRIQWAAFGPAAEVAPQAFAFADEKNAHVVPPSPRMIVSPGGAPNDVDLYIAQRALELTASAVTDGGEVLFISACPKGVGEPHTMENFFNRLTRPLDEIFASIQGEYKLFSHKPYKFARMIERFRRIWMFTEIPDAQVSAAHLYPTRDPQAVVDGWLAQDPQTRILVVDGANKVCLYPARSAVRQ